MKVIRSYASTDDAVNVKRILLQIIELEIEKLVNTNDVNPSTSHNKITHGGDFA